MENHAVVKSNNDLQESAINITIQEDIDLSSFDINSASESNYDLFSKSERGELALSAIEEIEGLGAIAVDLVKRIDAQSLQELHLKPLRGILMRIVDLNDVVAGAILDSDLDDLSKRLG